jgi:hypothetical protein
MSSSLLGAGIAPTVTRRPRRSRDLEMRMRPCWQNPEFQNEANWDNKMNFKGFGWRRRNWAGRANQKRGNRVMSEEPRAAWQRPPPHI